MLAGFSGGALGPESAALLFTAGMGGALWGGGPRTAGGLNVALRAALLALFAVVVRSSGRQQSIFQE